MESCLYRGWVWHARSEPVANRFRYRVFLLCLELDELDHVFDGCTFWSVERSNLASFRRADHLRLPGPLAVGVRTAVELQLGFRPQGPIRILTHLRYLGYCFNPISIYYCYGADGSLLEAVLCEVHNTPWGEEYLRALDTRGGPRPGAWHHFTLDKEFHVSPFMPMEIAYRWSFTEPGRELGVRMEDHHQGHKIFEAGLELQRRELTPATLNLALLRWPFMTGRVVAAIYWQALKLRLKGVPFSPHPEGPTVTKGMYLP